MGLVENRVYPFSWSNMAIWMGRRMRDPFFIDIFWSLHLDEARLGCSMWMRIIVSEQEGISWRRSANHSIATEWSVHLWVYWYLDPPSTPQKNVKVNILCGKTQYLRVLGGLQIWITLKMVCVLFYYLSRCLVQTKIFATPRSYPPIM